MRRLILSLIWVFCAMWTRGEEWWAFQPVKVPVIPQLGAVGVGMHPLDAFVMERLQKQRFSMNPQATPRELVRRAYYDLVGLPPTFSQVRDFESDPSETAWAELVDELLSRPQYGERWGRHWLDVVRYAESNGYERDGPKPHAWRYRDYVIRAFNEDKPYDRFVREQLAGDQLPDFSRDALIATGFYRLHVWDDEPDSTLQAEFDDLDDIMVTTSGAFMGLTMGCARCHDHKFDPIPQKEYYELLSFFRSINPYGQHHKGGGGRGPGKITRYLASAEEMAAWENNRSERLMGAERALAEVSRELKRQDIQKTIERIKSEKPPFDEALVVTEEAGEPKPTHLLVRGLPDAVGEEVFPGVPAVLGPTLKGDKDRRLALAHWLTDRRHPLTARVLVNRVWHYHFGRGIVATPNDFGRTGSYPSHPELLDHLAMVLMDGGWSVKRLHRYIMTSKTYRMSSRAGRHPARESDPGNELLWRQNPRRLEAEAIRDSFLFYSGTLNYKMGGPGFFPELPREVHQTQDSVQKGWGKSEASEQNRRSVYGVVKRALPYPLLETFDYSNTTLPLPRRPVTTVAPQALFLLNDDFVQKQAGLMAQKLSREIGGSVQDRIAGAFTMVLQRQPRPEEETRVLRFLKEQQEGRVVGGDDHDLFALTQLCVSLFNLNEAIYVD